MSIEIKPEVPAWTSESLRGAVRRGPVILKDNADGKSDCWIKLKLVETADGASVFGWAASAD